MENLAYLHLARAYEEPLSAELLSLSSLLNTSGTPNWKRFSSKAWRYLLPLVATLAILSVVSNALALEKGDRGPSVRRLQQELKRVGLYQAPITQVYDATTEAAVRRFQKTAGMEVNGVAEADTVEKLRSWNPQRQNTANRKPSTSNSRSENSISTATKPSSENTTTARRRTENNSQTAKKPSAETTATRKDDNPNVLSRGDEGEKVKVLQERLRVAGFYYGNATGVFGPITEEAVKRFQEAYKLRADGIVGPGTDRKLPPVGVGFGEDSTPRRSSNNNADKLTVGDRGEAVRLLQEQLIKAGYLQGEPNGYFGPYTQEAVRRFQSDNYLKPSGIAGPTTRGKLHSLVSPSSKSEFNVLEIQRRLQEKGFYKGPLDGTLSEETKRSIRQAQEHYGISLNDVRSGSF
ncbi:MAG: peptidoglycan-binding protein [Scytonematopsis contorta HA4267-MV1]|jgi:peptidoglycan hydrolase-like protein with peptidoglycan-binding domain|nr:peptidoglycan-binding protein [Scytonematopsis contorta HA4267-MV1]